MSYGTDYKIETSVYREDELTKNRLYGLWRGRVEYNQDPLQKGRVKVRVNEVHGEFEGGEVNSTNWWMPTEDLPWAEVVHTYGGGYDHGSFIIPEVGATCFVMFEKADPAHPLVVGYWYSSPEYHQKMNVNQDESQPPEWLEKSMGKWYGKNAPEPPLESQGIRNLDPRRHVLFKSPKGHTIVFEDRDEAESIEIIDRAGQSLRFECYVDKEHNEENQEQRGLRSVFKGNQLERSKLKNRKAKIIFKDLAGSYIEMDAGVGTEKISIVAKPSSTSKSQQNLHLMPSQNKTIIESVKDGELMSSVSLDGTSGGVELYAVDHITLDTSKLIILGDLTVDGDVAIGGDSRVGGKSVASKHVGES